LFNFYFIFSNLGRQRQIWLNPSTRHRAKYEVEHKCRIKKSSRGNKRTRPNTKNGIEKYVLKIFEKTLKTAKKNIRKKIKKKKFEKKNHFLSSTIIFERLKMSTNIQQTKIQFSILKNCLLDIFIPFISCKMSSKICF